MERVVITIHPPQPDDGLLSVSDAMQQVLDAIYLLISAQQALVTPEKAFNWRLESASASSPFTVTALAVAKQPDMDISAHARHIKDVVSSGLTSLIQDGEPSWWMKPEVIDSTRALFERTLNGIARTVIDFSPDNTISIDRASATAGMRAIEGFDALSVGKEIAARIAWGEIEGIMVAVGRYQKKAAIQIRSEQYKYVWCTLSDELSDRFGGEHRLEEVWSGKLIGVKGRLNYGEGGKLSRIEAVDIREIYRTAPIDLDSLMDPDFTAGLHPVEYLRQLNEGDLG
jgi:hypothetical protein